MPVIDLRNATVFLRDAGTNYIEVRIGEGTFSYNEKRNILFAKSRGVMDRVREGEEEPMDVSFQFLWEHIGAHGSDPATVEDVLKHRGPASGWVSTNPDVDAPFSIDIIVEQAPDCNNQDESLYFSQFYYTTLNHDLKNATVDCSGGCNYNKALVF